MKNGGSYPQTPKAELLDDGRIIRLLEDFVYVDPQAVKWTAPKGARADGASIPRALWPLIGGPLEGRYRNASIVHDFYCSKRHKPWKDVHRMFFDAMITSGVGVTRANVMYAGVYWGGPRWSQMDIDNTTLPLREMVMITPPGGRPRMQVVTRSPTSAKKTAAKKAYRYELQEEDVQLLLGQAKRKSVDLEAIEQHVDQLLVERKPKRK